MKKLLILVPVLSMFLVGCTENTSNSGGLFSNTDTVVCTMEESDEEGTSKAEFEAVLDGDVVKTVKITLELVAATDEGKEGLATMQALMENSGDLYQDDEGVKTTSNLNGNTYTYTMTVDYEKITDESLEEIDFEFDEENGKATVDALIQNAEAEGYTCKVK